MKKLLLMLMVLLPLIASSQTIFFDVNKMQIGTLTSSYENDEFINHTKWNEGEDVKLLMILDIEKGIIKLNNVSESTYNLMTMKDKKGERLADSDGDMTTMFTYTGCWDDKNVGCDIRIRTWDKYGLIQLYVDYKNLIYCWSGKCRPLEDQPKN
jgi:hypothetical protein